MSLFANYGDSSATGMPTSPYKRNFDGSFMKGSDGRWALEGPESTIQWTTVSPESYIERTGDYGLVNGNTGRAPGASEMFQDLRPSFGDQTGQQVTFGNKPDVNWYGGVDGYNPDKGYAIPKDEVIRPPAKPWGRERIPGLDDTIDSNPALGALAAHGLRTGTAFGSGVTPSGTYRRTDPMVDDAIARQTSNNPDVMPQNGPPLSRINFGPDSLVSPNRTFLTPAQANDASLGGKSVLNPEADPNSLGRSAILGSGLGAGWDKLARSDYGGVSYNDRTYDQQVAYEKTLGARPADPIYPTPTGDAPAAPGTPAAAAKTGEGHYDQNGNWVYGAVAALGAGALDAGGRVVAANILSKAAEAEAKAKADAADKASGLQDTRLQDMKDYLKPWYDDGKLALEGKDGHGGLNTFFEDNPDFQSETDPGFKRDYAFRLKEGMDALEGSMSARGGLFSGNAMRAMQKYGQDMASQEVNNSFNRYQTNRGMKLNALQSRAGLGQTTAQQVGSAGLSSATNSGNAMMSAAQARGDGITGRANADASMYSNGGGMLANMVGQMYGAYNQNAMMDRFERMYGKGI